MMVVVVVVVVVVLIMIIYGKNIKMWNIIVYYCIFLCCLLWVIDLEVVK